MAETKWTGETVAGAALVMGMFAGIVASVFAFFTLNLVGAGVRLGAAGLSFDLVADAARRR